MSNNILNKPVTGPLLAANQVSPSVSTYTSGQVTVDMGAYAYYYSDDNPAPAQEGFQLNLPRVRATDPWSAVRATINASNKTYFGSLFGLSTFNSSAVAVAVHRPRDVIIVLDLSGSMRFQSLPGTAHDEHGYLRRHGHLRLPEQHQSPRTQSMNPETIFPQFGHYSDVATAALQGTTTLPGASGEYVDPSNISSTQNSGPPICADFYSYPLGGTAECWQRGLQPRSGRSGDDSRRGRLPEDRARHHYHPAQTVAQFNNNTATTYPAFEVNGYQSVRGTLQHATRRAPATGARPSGSGRPRRAAQCPEPAQLADQHHFQLVQQPVQRLAAALLRGGQHRHQCAQLGQPQHHPVRHAPAPAPTMNTPGINDHGHGERRVRHLHLPHQLRGHPVLAQEQSAPTRSRPPSQAGRIRYYSSIPERHRQRRSTTAGGPPTPPALPDTDERFWKEYIDFVLGFYGTGAEHLQPLPERRADHRRSSATAITTRGPAAPCRSRSGRSRSRRRRTPGARTRPATSLPAVALQCRDDQRRR